MATPSKRSQVAGMQTITSNQPVARPVDTFVSYRPPAKKEGASALLDALSTISPVLGKMSAAKRKAEEEDQKYIIETEASANFDKFVEDWRNGKYKGFTGPAQLLGYESIGKRLARQYGGYLDQKYVEDNLATNNDPTYFTGWEEQQRANFITENKDLFSQHRGVVNGFAGAMREYTSGKESAYRSVSSENLVKTRKADFRDAVFLEVDAFRNTGFDVISFQNNVKLAQQDASFANGFANSVVNEETVTALIDYANDMEGMSHEQRLQVLDLADTIETTKGSFLGSTREAQLKIGKARTALISKEEARINRENSRYNQAKILTRDIVNGTIISELVKDSQASFESIVEKLTPDDRDNMKFYYTDVQQFFSKQQDYFQGRDATVNPESFIKMRLELGGARSKTEALNLITSWQRSQRLPKDIAAINTLFTQANSIKDGAKAVKDFNDDPYFRTFYANVVTGGAVLEGQIGMIQQIDPSNAAKRINFLDKFISLYYSDEYTLPDSTVVKYQELDELRKKDAVFKIYQQVMAN